MTYEEAIECLKSAIHITPPRAATTARKHNESIGLAIEALKRQIPKKPIVFISDRYDYPEEAYRCSVCESDNGEYLYKGQRYCDECGNAVDWSDIK